ncbi:hypothetical protein GCM10027020_37920 [Nocardioides salsibiostraticola]
MNGPPGGAVEEGAEVAAVQDPAAVEVLLARGRLHRRSVGIGSEEPEAQVGGEGSEVTVGAHGQDASAARP